MIVTCTPAHDRAPRRVPRFALRRRPLVGTALLLVAWGVVWSAEPEASSSAAPQYATQIAPLLAARCGACHDADHAEADLVLTTPAGLRRGGASGRAFLPGAAAESLLIQRLSAGEMPPEGPPLTADEIDLLRRWIDAGAVLPDDSGVPEVTQHDVLPILQLRCTVCHGRRIQEGGLDLRSVEGLLRWGCRGPPRCLASRRIAWFSSACGREKCRPPAGWSR